MTRSVFSYESPSKNVSSALISNALRFSAELPQGSKDASNKGTFPQGAASDVTAVA